MTRILGSVVQLRPACPADMRDVPVPLAELDIWMRSEAHTGHGYGSDALRALIRHPQLSLGLATFLIRPSARNPRAIRAYEKAGFRRVSMTAEQQAETYGPGDYADTVVLLMDGTARQAHRAGAPGAV